ncbi:MAG: glycosyl transferase group 1 [Thermoleophilia bacterium]|nr:glycosyl transferase group 1 [Thermoleophilia bacterium]
MSEPLRILVLHNRYTQAGGEDTVVDGEVAALRERGHEVELLEVVNVEPEQAGAAERLRIAKHAVWSGDAAEHVSQIAAEFRPDVAHVHNHAYELSASVFPALADLGIPVVQTLHNYRMTCSATYLLRDGKPCELCVGSKAAWHGIQHRCFRGSRSGSTMLAGMQLAWRRAAIPNVDRFIVLTEFAREIFERAGLPAEQLVVRPNTVRDVGFAGADRAEDAPLLFVGRLEPSKGIGVLLDAIGEHRLVVAGDGPLRASLEAAAPDNVTFVGQRSRDEIDGLMRTARALVVPSTWYEGFPMVVLEAFAAGTPVIASDLGALAEIVPDAVGWRTPPQDPDALSATLEVVLADCAEAERRGAAARTRYEATYTQDIVMAQLEGIYRDACVAVK